MTDIFEEVEEQLRSERYIAFVRKIWPWALGIGLAALLAALAWWGYDSYRKREAAKASEAYAAAIETLAGGDSKKAYVQLGQVVKEAPKGYRALALMQQAAIRLGDNKVEEAVSLFDKAADAAPDPIVGDMARLKSAFALMDTAPYPAMEERLKPLTDAKRPYSAVAREALAMAKLRAGKIKEARADFVVLRLLPDAPEPVHQRAELAIQAIDSGAAADLGPAVKAALAAPPPPPTVPNLQIQPQAGAAQ